MCDNSTRRPLQIPPWQIPYLEKHRIFELFHEIARELVIQQPDDHVMFIKQVLSSAARARDTARVILIGSPKVNCLEVAKAIAQKTKQKLVTASCLSNFMGMNKDMEKIKPDFKAKCISRVVRKDDGYELGWILLGCIKSEEEGKALIRQGILPTHVIHLISPFQPPLDELLYCNVRAGWPEYRRHLLSVRKTFQDVLNEVYLQQRSLLDVADECIKIMGSKNTKCPIKPRILLIGPRGSGRKTQAKLLADHLNLVHVNFESLLCESVLSLSKLGEQIRACREKVCFHSELLAQIINKKILEEDCLDQGWVLTGFPFYETDLRYLDMCETPPNRIIFLECDLTICRNRLKHRRIHVYTGSVVDLEETPDGDGKRIAQHPKDHDDIVEAEKPSIFVCTKMFNFTASYRSATMYWHLAAEIEPNDAELIISAKKLSHYCENYGSLRKYCGPTASCINADQSERWVYEGILGIINKAPNATPPREGLVQISPTSSSDSCCCTPIPSTVMDYYINRV